MEKQEKRFLFVYINKGAVMTSIRSFSDYAAQTRLKANNSTDNTANSAKIAINQQLPNN